MSGELIALPEVKEMFAYFVMIYRNHIRNHLFP